MDTTVTVERAIAPWDIVRVDFPFADASTSRRRPGLVIAALDATAAFSILWVVMITSARQGLWPLDVPISDLVRGGLSNACVVRVSKVTALDSRMAVRIGDVSVADRAKVAACLQDVLRGVLGG